MLLNSVSLGIALFSLSYLAIFKKANRHSALVAWVIAILGWILSGPFWLSGSTALKQGYIALLPVSFFLLLPLMTWFQQSLVAKHPWSFKGTHALAQLRPLWATLLVTPLSVSILLMPSYDFQQLFFADQAVLSRWGQINAAGFALALVLWLLLSSITLLRMAKVTRGYHRDIQHIFSNHSHKTLGWLSAFSLLLLLNWVYALLVLAFEDHSNTLWLSEAGVSVLSLVMMWVFCLYGLKQEPALQTLGLQEADLQAPVPPAVTDELDTTKQMRVPNQGNKIHENKSQDNTSQDNTSQESIGTEDQASVERLGDTEHKTQEIKQTHSLYQRSAIDEPRLSRIAEKIQQAVVQQQGYLDSDLNAVKLSQQLGVSTHYLSQTFSQQLKTTFYDYVNAARIEAAKVDLQSSDKTVLTVAMDSGFNTRSSFYNAFKKNTGMTPSEYRRGLRR